MKTTMIEPYLVFGGRCDEALEFYGKAIGAQVDFKMRYKESPEAMPPGQLPVGWEEKVMHVSFRVGGSRLMASDGCEPAGGFTGFSLSLAVPTEAEAARAYAALAEGGKMTMPLEKTFWSPCFGMVKDKFGISWMVSVER